MTLHPKKTALLDFLNKKTGPASFRDLVKLFNGAYSDRSVSRWLSELTAENLIEKIGDKKGAKYQSILQKEPFNGCFSSYSLEVIAKVRRPLYTRDPISYSEEWVSSYEPNKSYYIPDDRRKELHSLGKRLERPAPAGTYGKQIFNRLLIDLSYNSSRLEGNTYSLLETQKLLLQGKETQGKSDEEKAMILNHKEAIRYLVDRAEGLDVTKETIYTVHYLLSDGLIERCYSGKVRDHGVKIGGSCYFPLEGPKRLEGLLDLITEKAAMIRDPYEESLFLLVQISYLQAFADVNKRTARLSCNIPLIKHNLVPLSFNDVVKEDYASAMIAVYELRDVHPIVDLYCFSYTKTSLAYDATAQSMNFDEVRVRYRQERRALIRTIILQKLKGKELEEYIIDQSKLIPERISFIEDVKEDLSNIDKHHIEGLGITEKELLDWQDSP